MWVYGGREIKLDQAEFIGMDSLSRSSAFNVAAHGAGWLVEIRTKMWPTVSELEVLDLPRVLLERKGFKGVGILEC